MALSPVRESDDHGVVLAPAPLAFAPPAPVALAAQQPAASRWQPGEENYAMKLFAIHGFPPANGKAVNHAYKTIASRLNGQYNGGRTPEAIRKKVHKIMKDEPARWHAVLAAKEKDDENPDAQSSKETQKG